MSEPVPWQHRAACLGANGEMFFPAGSTGPAARQIEAAKRLCTSCPVRQECLRWAVDLGIEHGVWGGLAEAERHSLYGRVAQPRKPVRGR